MKIVKERERERTYTRREKKKKQTDFQKKSVTKLCRSLHRDCNIHTHTHTPPSIYPKLEQVNI